MQIKLMSFEDFMVFFCLFCCWVARSKVFFLVCHVVVGPLVELENEECVAKAFCMLLVGGGAPARRNGGRATPWTQEKFDCTMGFPGEDLLL